MALAPLVLVLVAAAALLALPTRGPAGTNLHPVVLVPGYGSNQLEALLTATYKPPAPSCTVAADQLGEWFQLWPGMNDAAQAPCFAHQMSLAYDAGADDYRNSDGVTTRVPFFGSTRGLVGWDPLVRRLEGMGYRDGATLFGAPYDFRYAVAPPGHPSAVGARYFRDLARLIIRASRLNGGRPAIIVAHSFGCALTYQFLLSRPVSWRLRHVRHVVLLAPALGGFGKGIGGLVTGDGYCLPSYDAATRPIRVRLAWSQQSSLWRLPTPAVFGDRPLVVTANATYTARDIPAFLEAIGFGEGVWPYATRVLPMWRALPAPLVPVTSIIGGGVGTPETFVFGAEGFEGDPEVLYGDGDGDINMVSLLAVEEWAGVQGQVLKVVRLPGVNHSGFFIDDFALATVVAEIHEAGRSVQQLDRDMK